MTDLPHIPLAFEMFAPPFLLRCGPTGIGFELNVQGVVVLPRNRQAQVRNASLDALLFQVAALYSVPCTAVSWSMLSKQPVMSPSMNHITPVKLQDIWRRAE